MTAILDWVQMLRRKASDPKILEQALEIIERNAHVQPQLIEDLLDMSRIISGKVRLNVQPVSLTPLVRNAWSRSATRPKPRAFNSRRRLIARSRCAAMKTACSRCSGTCCQTPINTSRLLRTGAELALRRDPVMRNSNCIGRRTKSACRSLTI
jgi:signal transduction histidine kinase